MKSGLDKVTPSTDTEKKYYQPWANGFIMKGKRTYHHYLEIGFQFDRDK
jgi:hypothetical protein